MDLNCLLHRHQLSLMRADAANSPAARVRHDEDARGLAGLIASVRSGLGATGALVRVA